jgi:hypothetical protein
MWDFGDISYISIVDFTTRAELKVTSKTDVVYTINLTPIHKLVTKWASSVC